MEGTNPLTMSEWHSMDTSLPLRRNLDLGNTKILPEVLKIHFVQWLCQHISYLFVHRNILEHWVLRQLHTTLVVSIYTSSIQLEIK